MIMIEGIAISKYCDLAVQLSYDFNTFTLSVKTNLIATCQLTTESGISDKGMPLAFKSKVSDILFLI
jgi:hypothetical protein